MTASASLPPLVRDRTRQVLLVVLLVLVRYLCRPDDQEVLGVRFLGRLGELDTAGDDRLAVNDHDLVVGDGRAGEALGPTPARGGYLGADVVVGLAILVAAAA